MEKLKFNFEIDSNGCFNCISHKSTPPRLYPQASHNSKPQSVARHIYEACFGEVPNGLVVRHKCDNRKCINPEHLELGTPQDNMNDMVERGRSVAHFGINNGRSKYSVELINEIRLLEGIETSKQVAEKYGISDRYIRDIWNGRRRAIM